VLYCLYPSLSLSRQDNDFLPPAPNDGATGGTPSNQVRTCCLGFYEVHPSFVIFDMKLECAHALDV
jgi:hypothetical protein